MSFLLFIVPTITMTPTNGNLMLKDLAKQYIKTIDSG